MSTDYRVLCAELIEAVLADDSRLDILDIAGRARAALAAEPVVEGPTNEELRQMFVAHSTVILSDEGDDMAPLGLDAAGASSFARAVLARWGRPAPASAGEVGELVEWLHGQDGGIARRAIYSRIADLLSQRHPAPVPVAERLPGPEDCDEEGRCWLFSKVEKEWRLIDAGNPGVPHLKYCFSHWLPATALPLPQGEVQP